MTPKSPGEPAEPGNIPPEEIPQSEDGLLESEAERKERESKQADHPAGDSDDSAE